MTESKPFLWTDRGVTRFKLVIVAFIVFVLVMCGYWMVYTAKFGNGGPLNGLIIFLFGAVFFPGGLVEFLRQALGILNPALKATLPKLGGPFAIPLWSLYGVLAMLLIVVKNRRISFVLYLIFIVLLLSNVAGCVLMTPAIMQID